jgi:hypothetical protein
MKFKKGESGNPKGKPLGAENHITKDIKQAYKELIENNVDNLTKWLSDIAKNNPEKAIYILINLSEYVIPKLGRIDSDLTTKGEKITQSQYDLSKLSVEALKELKNAKTDI